MSKIVFLATLFVISIASHGHVEAPRVEPSTAKVRKADYA